MPETFDLDRAFDDLARDVAARSHPAGAARAVTTARRRRTSLAALAALAVLSVGGLAVSQLGGGDASAPQPGGPQGDVTVPPSPTQPVAARQLDAAALDEAFDGWGEWKNSNGSAGPSPHCLGLTPQDPVSGRSSYFDGGPGVDAAFVNVRYASAAAAGKAFDAFVDDLEGCEWLGEIRPVAADGGQGAYATMSSAPGDLPQVIWLVRVDDRVGTFTVAGGQDTPPDDVVQAVAAAMAADDPGT